MKGFLLLILMFTVSKSVYSAETSTFDLYCEGQNTDFNYRVYSSPERSFIQVLADGVENFGHMDNLKMTTDDAGGSHPGYFLILNLENGSEAAALFINTQTSEVNGSITNHLAGVTSGVNCTENATFISN